MNQNVWEAQISRGFKQRQVTAMNSRLLFGIFLKLISYRAPSRTLIMAVIQQNWLVVYNYCCVHFSCWCLALGSMFFCRSSQAAFNFFLLCQFWRVFPEVWVCKEDFVSMLDSSALRMNHIFFRWNTIKPSHRKCRSQGHFSETRVVRGVYCHANLSAM